MTHTESMLPGTCPGWEGPGGAGGIGVLAVQVDRISHKNYQFRKRVPLELPVPRSWILRDFESSAVFETLHCPGNGIRDSGRCGASKFGSAAIFLFPPAHPWLPAFGRGIGQEHDYISCMPVQLKINCCIVIIVTIVAVVKVAREKI